MTNPALRSTITDVTETSLLFGAWYTDANKFFDKNSGFSDKIINIFFAAINLGTTAGAVWLQNSTLKSLGRYTNKFQPSTSAASAGYALTRIIINRDEGIMESSISDNGKETAIALAGSIAIFSMEMLSKNTSKLDFAGSFLLGVTTGFCKSIFDDAAINAFDKILNAV